MKRAQWHGDRAACIGCGTDLAAVIYGQTYIIAGLVPMPTHRENLPTYGLPKRVLTTNKDARSRSRDGWQGRVELPVFAYCPRKGICGMGQVIPAPPLAR